MHHIFFQPILNLHNKKGGRFSPFFFFFSFPVEVSVLNPVLFVASLSVIQSLLFFPPRLSFDEGRNWDKYSFTSSPLYVDGVLGEPGEDTLIMT